MKDYLEKICKIKDKIDSAETIVIGAGAGLSAAAGLKYSGERFENAFGDFIEKYKLTDMYTSGFYQFPTQEIRWAYWSRHIWLNRYQTFESDTYKNLLDIVKDKNYFVITTNVDHLFQKNGFDKERLFYTQGDYGLWQCCKPCHDKTYDNYEMVKEMVEKQENMEIPKELIPYCPKCGRPMSMNLRADLSFVQDDGWDRACQRYSDFIQEYKGKNVLFLELGVGGNTPSIIKYPFWKYVFKNENATYCTINLERAIAPQQIEDRSICIEHDIDKVIKDLK